MFVDEVTGNGLLHYVVRRLCLGLALSFADKTAIKEGQTFPQQRRNPVRRINNPSIQYQGLCA